MRTHEFRCELWLPRPLGEVFSFFADAGNLELLTPPQLNFHILTPCPLEMRVGLLIEYRLRVRGIPLRWQSEITAWEPPHRFVDEERRGPYRLWQHEHLFEERDGGRSRSTGCVTPCPAAR
ncbi:MAG: SRPBCC family protein [Terrimicrobiaceae bacterium]